MGSKNPRWQPGNFFFSHNFGHLYHDWSDSESLRQRVNRSTRRSRQASGLPQLTRAKLKLNKVTQKVLERSEQLQNENPPPGYFCPPLFKFLGLWFESHHHGTAASIAWYPASSWLLQFGENGLEIERKTFQKWTQFASLTLRWTDAFWVICQLLSSCPLKRG